MKKRRVIQVAGVAAVVTAMGGTAFALPALVPVAPQALSLSHAQQYAGDIGTGPSTQISPYLLPTNSGVDIVSLLSVREPGVNGAAGTIPAGYPTVTGAWNRMSGIPDGMGAYLNGNGDIVLFMNHELGKAVGATRDHGTIGSFVSKLTLDPSTLQVETAEDLVKTISYYDYVTGTYVAAPTGGFSAAFDRFCSGFLAKEAQLQNGANGFAGKIWFGNEETTNGRAFAINAADGAAIQLPRAGLFGWENTVMATTGSDVSILMGNDDSTPSNSTANLANPAPFSDAGFLRMYVGTKTNTGTFADKAGLTNGGLYTLKVSDSVFTDKQFRTTFGKNNPQPVSFVSNDWTAPTQLAQNTEAQTKKSMAFWRVEDGVFDPRPGHENVYWFLTTQSEDSRNQAGALWKLTLTDLQNPAAGGTLEMVLNGSESTGAGDAITSPDNMEMTADGNIIIQEDPGSTIATASAGGNYPDGRNALARVFAFNVDTYQLAQIAQFDKSKFDANPNGTSSPTPVDTANYLTRDEESSGLIDASALIGPGWFLLNAQVHTTNTIASPASASGNKVDSYEVENGQLMAMKIDFPTLYAEGPAPIVPEVPFAVLLPIMAGVTFAGYKVVSNRKASHVAAG
jgi:hypothetical protein